MHSRWASRSAQRNQNKKKKTQRPDRNELQKKESECGQGESPDTYLSYVPSTKPLSGIFLYIFTHAHCTSSTLLYVFYLNFSSASLFQSQSTSRRMRLDLRLPDIVVRGAARLNPTARHRISARLRMHRRLRQWPVCVLHRGYRFHAQHLRRLQPTAEHCAIPRRLRWGTTTATAEAEAALKRNSWWWPWL